MADRWFRVPTSSTTDGPYTIEGPKYRNKSGIDGHAGNTIGNSPRWIVRFYGDDATLDEIAAASDTTELTASGAADRFATAAVGHLPETGWDQTTVGERFRSDRGEA